ncbi:MAG: UbiD family decarboxylase [Chloroflexi bacterium]|nr:UbiD family decarboxylase [Chloroflexota bacterium]
MFDDLREFLKRSDELGLCKTVEGADWNLEIGGITELGLSVPTSPMLVFDRIKGYPAGYRVVSNFQNRPELVALTFGLPPETSGLDQARAWRDKVNQGFVPVPPVEVSTGPVRENVHVGDDVDLFEFPVPRWHERDGGRYIGTGGVVIQRDPDEGFVNLGTYRVQVHDKNTATIFIVESHHGEAIRKKWWARGLPCPAVVVCGEDPLLWSVSTSNIKAGVSEYDYAGWLRGRPVEVVRGEFTDLPIPAGAEIALEGEIVPPGTETREEGPFGEWTGYYVTGSREEPAFRVKAVLHRNDPIILGAPPQIGTYDYSFGKHIMRSGFAWAELDRNVPGVKGVWTLAEAKGPSIMIASVKQQYAGHAKQAANFLSGCRHAAYMCRFLIVVDDDIDPSNIAEVLWALGTRCEPETSIDILRGCWGSMMDSMLSPEKRRSGDFSHSQAVIVACKPYHWIKDFPVSVKSSPEALRGIKEKWGKTLFGA